MDGLYSRPCDQSHACQPDTNTRAARNEFQAILSGFLSNICAQDLQLIMSDLNIKCVHIPRQAFKYLQRPWGYVSFESEAQMNFAMDRTGMGFNGRPLFWSNRDGKTKLCLHCGNPNHQIKDCTLKRRASNKKVVSDEWQPN